MEQHARVKVTVAAKRLGVNPWTWRRWIYAGKVPHIKTETGRVFVPTVWIETQIGDAPGLLTQRCALYARASSSENTAALASQLDGLRAYASAKGYQIVHLVREVASGMNDDRPKLHALLKLKDFDILLGEHKERLSRFGFKWFEALCPFRIEVINVAETLRTDLMEDLVAIVTSFAARLYGQRRGRQKTLAAIKALQEPTP
jgi:predicted site-specific integrase-resolvase